ncbi:MAG: ROK family transcriptional regulator [Bauldia sp.]|nr:ROK family transcriptional regulator [Bauldia sp.]
MLDQINPLGPAANTAKHVGRHNRRVVLHALRVHGSLSRAELARFTGLTPQAVANIVDTLMTSGLVREAGRRKTRRGQPPIAIEIANDGGYAVGVRIDATSFDAVASGLGGELIEMREGPVPDAIETDWLDFVAGIHDEFGARFGTDRCLGIGLVTPGPFDIDWPGVPTPGAIPQLQGRGIVDQLAARTGTDVFLENDAYAAALGEKLYGQATEFSDFFYVYVGEGVGGGIVLRGEPYRGTRGNAGEFGHLIVDPNGPQCYCGNRGCLGEYLSLGSMRTFLRDAEAAGERHDDAMERWVARASDALSVGIAGIENLFDPEIVVIGGSAPVQLLERLAAGLGDLRASVRQDLGRQRLRVSTLGERSAALGASALPILAATNV